jgi:2-dehydro-3-deoxyphosphogluconate aldolase / (4S)-4-hydroxy-2-oxoglutarate aldolase
MPRPTRTNQSVAKHQSALRSMLRGVCVVPVITLDDPESAVPVAETLGAEGFTVLEVTLRTPSALKVLEKIACVPGIIVGAGTLTGKENFRHSVEAGARFGVSPGATNSILQSALDSDLPLLPGSDSVSQSIWLREHGYRLQKFFPAEASGGVAKLKAVYPPLADLQFCATGGISAKNVADYLSLPNVICVGSSSFIKQDVLSRREWGALRKDAKSFAQIAVQSGRSARTR